MSIEGYKVAIEAAEHHLGGGDSALPVRDLQAGQVYATIAIAEMLEAIHQRLMNLALKGDK